MERNSERRLNPLLMALVAWYIADYLMNVVNLTLNLAQLGRLGDMRVTFLSFVGDYIGWSHALPYWFSLLLPATFIVGFFVARTRLTWQAALKVGLIIVAAQLVVGIAKNVGHLSEPWILLWYLERLTVFVGPLVACLATKIDLINEPTEA